MLERECKVERKEVWAVSKTRRVNRAAISYSNIHVSDVYLCGLWKQVVTIIMQTLNGQRCLCACRQTLINKCILPADTFSE